MTYEKAEEFANNKLEIVSSNKNLTEQEKNIYWNIFFVDYLQNTIYERKLINDLLYVKK
ncbi:hypothetical protein [[Clostridium] colinum]|uniref:hypothetical protein n=1 Tax=[Clostridium] colinum TaxID=36835 RepID=UPI00202462C8|nr:hypothetical protein [[Clostridium] colinum]